MAGNDKPAPDRTTIDRLRFGIFPSLAMLAGLQMEVFTHLQDGPRTSQALADALGAKKHKLELLLYALVGAGLLTVGDEGFANTPETNHFFVKGRASYIGGMHELLTEMWGSAFKTSETLLTGVPQAKIDFSSASEEEVGAWLRGLHGNAMNEGRMLARKYEMGKYQHLADIAGGSGGVALGAVEECPGLQATVVDLSNVTHHTRRFIAEAGQEERVNVESTDVIARPPECEMDFAVVRNFIQIISREDAAKAFKHIGQRVKTGGRLLMVGWVVDDSRITPPSATGVNLFFLNRFDEGEAYTEAEYRQWLGEAGFVDYQKELLGNGMSVVSATKE